jgi:hypothetical protein
VAGVDQGAQSSGDLGGVEAEQAGQVSGPAGLVQRGEESLRDSAGLVAVVGGFGAQVERDERGGEGTVELPEGGAEGVDHGGGGAAGESTAEPVDLGAENRDAGPVGSGDSVEGGVAERAGSFDELGRFAVNSPIDVGSQTCDVDDGHGVHLDRQTTPAHSPTVKYLSNT